MWGGRHVQWAGSMYWAGVNMQPAGGHWGGRWGNGEVGGRARGVVWCARGMRVGERWWVGIVGRCCCDGGVMPDVNGGGGGGT